MATDDLTNAELFKKLLEVIENQAKKTYEDISTEIKSETQTLLAKIEKQNIEITQLKESNQKLTERCTRLERAVRRNNLLIFGLKPVRDEISLLDYAISQIKELLEIVINPSEINNIYRLDNVKGNPIKIEFISYHRKILILKSCNKLKNTKTFITHDLCFEDRQDLKILQDNLRLARSMNLSAVIRGNNLIVNGEKFRIDQLRDNNITNLHPLSIDNQNKTVRHTVGAGILKEPSPELHEVKRKKNYSRNNSASSLVQSKPLTRADSKQGL